MGWLPENKKSLESSTEKATTARMSERLVRG